MSTIAICLYGFPYFYRSAFTDVNNLRNSLKALENVGNIDFYIHFWGTPENVGKMFKRSWERVREGDRVIKPRVKEWLTEKYKPTEILNDNVDLIKEDGWKESLEKVKGMLADKTYDYYIFLPLNTCFDDNEMKTKIATGLQTGIFSCPHVLQAYISNYLEAPENKLNILHGIYYAKM